MNVGHYRDLFLFAAKAGALEGYIYERSKTELLTNWIDNISNMYQGLPDSIKKEINEAYASVLQKILQYGGNVLEDSLKEKLKRMLSLATGT